MSREYYRVSRAIMTLADLCFCFFGGYLVYTAVEKQSVVPAILGVLSLRVIPNVKGFIEANNTSETDDRD